MKHAQPVSIFSRASMTAKAVLVGVAILALLAIPARSPAQDAGVSGIPPGPANARGLNGSVNDPSGIGNAAKVPAPPSPTITPVMPPAASAPVTASRPYPAQRVVKLQRAVKLKRTRFVTHRSRRVSRTATRTRDRGLGGGIPSICRGC
jgi:hypothetical protein